jgi:ribosomal protein S18 acetylase RimI-like enzyme
LVVSTVTDLIIRRGLRPTDVDGIVELHRRVYVAEYDRNQAFLDAVRDGVEAAVADGWPDREGAVWLIGRGGLLTGSLALTDEGDGVGCVRWVVFERALRGLGLGRRLVTELVEEARAAGLRRLELNTYSTLRAAAHLYRDAGFRVVSERVRDDWGPPIVYQHYELEL